MLRDFQGEIVDKVYSAWQAPSVRNVMVVSPTGSGKTVILGHILKQLMWPTVAIAHRQELVGQLALALNREQVPHGIVAPEAVIRQIVQLEMETHNKSFYQARSPIRVAGVNTLERRGKSKDVKPELQKFLDQCQLAIVDEGHHVLKENIWGRALGLLPNARGLLFTAHAVRADGCGLGRSADGLVDSLVVGPSCRELINRGFLTDYRLICPPSDIDVSNVPVGPSGELELTKLRAAIHRSKTIVGDVAAHYLKFAAGKLGITFAVDIESASEIAGAYRAVGVPAEVITADTPIPIRAQLMRKLRRRELLQLVNVDVLGEGVDVPAVEVVSMARHTASWQLLCQQFGRGARLVIPDGHNDAWHTYTDAQRLALIASGPKPKFMVIDHVGNIKRHHEERGLPDSPQVYSLAPRPRRSGKGPSDAIPLRVCLNDACLHPYPRVYASCPRCGLAAPAPSGRATPQMVDGDLIELDAAALAALRGEAQRINDSVRIPAHLAGTPAATALLRNHNARQLAQQGLCRAIALYAGYHRERLAQSDSEIYKRFFFTFGVDVASAQTLNKEDATALSERIAAYLQPFNIVEAA